MACAKANANSFCRNAQGQGYRFVQPKSVAVGQKRDRGQRRDRIYSARAEQYEASMVRHAVFENIDKAPKIVFKQLATAEAALNSGQDARVSRCIDDPIRGRQNLEVARGSNVAVDKCDAEGTESGTVGFRSGADKVVDTTNRQ